MTQIWFPVQLARILDQDDMPVVFMDQIGQDSMLKDLDECENIGVATLSKVAQVDLLCLITLSRIYVFDMNQSKHQKVLKKLFANENRKFCTRDGTYDALAIAKKMDVHIENYNNFYDLTTLELNLNLKATRQEHKHLILTTEDFIIKGPVQRSYQQLVEIWLGGDKINMNCTERELSAVKERPLDEFARNFIKKKCALIAFLANLLWLEFDDRIAQKSKDLMSLGYRANNQLMERFSNEKTGQYAQFCQYLQLCPEKQ